jgi:peptidyl-prolyl cis-trans isomerase D
MLSSIRAFAQTWIAKALIGLLILTFAGFGVSGYLHGVVNTNVVTAGGHTVPAVEFKRIIDADLERAGQQQGQPVSAKDAVAAGLDTRLLGQISDEKAYAEYARRLGVTAADSLIAEAIAKEPAFANQVTGVFDRSVYISKLREKGIAPATYENELRDEMMEEQLDFGVMSGVRMPRTYAALYAIGRMETRDMSLFVITPKNVPQPPAPTDAEMQAFINQNADRLKQPETRVLTVVRFSAKALAATTPVDPARVQQLFDFRKDTASTPEKRSLVQIPVKDAAAAAQVVTRLRAGQDPAAVAKSIGAQPILYTDAAKGAIADGKIADAAFSMQAGEVRGPIQGDLGLGVIKLNAIQPGHVATLDEMRPQLEAQARNDAAQARVNDLVRRFQDARNKGAGVAQAAQAVGATLQTVGPLTEQGKTLSTPPPPGALSEALLRDAFRLPAGADSDLDKDAAGEYFAVHVDKVLPPAVPSLADIKPQLEPYLASVAMEKAMAAKATELVNAIKKGESFEAAAASIATEVRKATGVTLGAAMQNQYVGQDLAQRIFAAKKGDVFAGPTPQHTLIVARIDGSGAPGADVTAQPTVQVVADGSPSLAQDFAVVLRNTAKTVVKPKTDLALARQAIGVSPADAPKPGQGLPTAPAP